MQKLQAVEEAKALMNQAKDWPVWRWLLEKRRVRAVADRATEALADREKKVKAAWPEDLRKAVNGRPRSLDPDLKLALQKVREADELAESARLDAEATFDEAERRLSTSMAREGAEKAITSWGLKEKAIRKAEAVGRAQIAAEEHR